MRPLTTNIDLVTILTELNTVGRYDALIQDCASGLYHDFLKPPDCTEPKVLLVKALKNFPELAPILQDVLNCVFDESDNVNLPEISDIAVTPT